MKHFYIQETEVPIYGGVFVVILTNDTEKLKKHFPDFPNDSIYAMSKVGEWKNRRGYIVVLNFKNIDKITHGVIAHEAIHISNFIAKDVGFTPNFDNDESIAYLTQWVVNNIYSFMKKHKFKAT